MKVIKPLKLVERVGYKLIVVAKGEDFSLLWHSYLHILQEKQNV